MKWYATNVASRLDGEKEALNLERNSKRNLKILMRHSDEHGNEATSRFVAFGGCAHRLWRLLAE
jgi:hypothetical protein